MLISYETNEERVAARIIEVIHGVGGFIRTQGLQD